MACGGKPGSNGRPRPGRLPPSRRKPHAAGQKAARWPRHRQQQPGRKRQEQHAGPQKPALQQLWG